MTSRWEDVKLQNPHMTLAAQLDHCATLEDGWAGPHSQAITPMALEAARRLVGVGTGAGW